MSSKSHSRLDLADLEMRLDALSGRLVRRGRVEFGEFRSAAEVTGIGILSQVDVLNWLGNIGSKSTSIYDRAMDARYLSDHVGGAQHRLFDGGHDVIGAWERVAGASDSDSVVAEVVGYVTAMLEDASTPAGLPLATWDPDSYKAVSGWFADVVPGATRSWFADLVSYDVGEILSCGLVVVCALLGMRQKDEEAVSEILGSSLVVSMASANPLMLIGLIVLACWCYTKREMRLRPTVIRGGWLGAVGVVVFDVLSLPILIELVAVVLVLVLARKGYDWVQRGMRKASADVWRELRLPVPATGSWQR